jgi:hypothetical protein
MGVSGAVPRRRDHDEEGPAELSPEGGPQTGKHRDSQDSLCTSEPIPSSQPRRIRSNRRLRRGSENQYPADFPIQKKKDNEGGKSSRRFPPNDGINTVAVEGQAINRTASLSTVTKVRDSVGSKAGHFPPALQETTDRIRLDYQSSPDSSEATPDDEQPRISRQKSSNSSGSQIHSRRRGSTQSNGSSPSTSSDETDGHKRRSKSRSKAMPGERPPRRDRCDSAPSIPVRRRQSENSSDDDSPRKQSGTRIDDRWESDSMSGPAVSTNAGTIISKSTIRRSSQAPQRTQSLIERQRDVATLHVCQGSKTSSVNVCNEVRDVQIDKIRMSTHQSSGERKLGGLSRASDVTHGQTDNLKISFRKSSSERKLGALSRASDVDETVDQLHPSVDETRKEQTKSRRFGFPKISRSCTVQSRIIGEKRTGKEVTSQDCNRQSRSSSLTVMFRKGADESVRSITQRTESTAATEPSTISYDSPVKLAKEEQGTVTRNEQLFGRLFVRPRDEADKLYLPSSVDTKIRIPTILPPRGPIRISGRRNRDKVSQDEESDIESVYSDDGKVTIPIPNRSIPLERRRAVGFGTVMVREYARSIGDNPSVSSGTPIGLDWSYFEPTLVDIDTFEADIRKPGPRTRKDFYLPAQKRFHILLDDWGYSVQEIGNARNIAAEIRKLRQMSTDEDQSMSQHSLNMDVDLQRMPRGQDRWDATPAIV